jgi:hypothetical protein
MNVESRIQNIKKAGYCFHSTFDVQRSMFDFVFILPVGRSTFVFFRSPEPDS